MSDRQAHLSSRPKLNPVWRLDNFRPVQSLKKCQAIARHSGKRCGQIALSGVTHCRFHGGDRLQAQRKARLEAIGAWPDKALQASMRRRREARERKAQRIAQRQSADIV
jgi:hypothetical protein